MVAELAYGAGPAPGRTAASRPPLRLAPSPRTASSPSRREAAYAVALGLVLGLGVVGVLVLNTLMQQQARTIAAQQAGLSALALRQQTVQLQLDALDNPRELARRAQALHMRPAGLLLPLRPAPAVSARGRGTRPTHGG
ncbi:MAG: hypothetical protein QOD07_2554 [Frankiaceae bacterium]|nr:hypothetical protein [Frankiaceae bacterium]